MGVNATFASVSGHFHGIRLKERSSLYYKATKEKDLGVKGTFIELFSRTWT